MDNTKYTHVVLCIYACCAICINKNVYQLVRLSLNVNTNCNGNTRLGLTKTYRKVNEYKKCIRTKRKETCQQQIY